MEFDPIDGADLDDLCRGYTAITNDPAKTRGKKQLVAACYRTHGPDTLAFVEHIYRETGTATNLLGLLRTAPRQLGADSAGPSPGPAPADMTADADVAVELRPQKVAEQVFDSTGWDGCRCPVETLLPELIYCGAHRPPFGLTGSARHDRRESNPLAIRFFESAATDATVDAVPNQGAVR